MNTFEKAVTDYILGLNEADFAALVARAMVRRAEREKRSGNDARR